MTRIPKTWLGEEIKGSLEKVLSEPQSQVARPINPVNAPNLDGYIYIPSTGLYVAKERTHFNENWTQCNESLKQEGQGLFMMNMYEFVEFLKHLKENPNQENNSIYESITAVRSPYRGEWIDARFNQKQKKMVIDYHKLDPIGNRELVHEALVDYLDENKTPGIDLEEWINNSTTQGFPRKDSLRGDLYYYAPVNGRVARFDADSDGARLKYDRNPDCTDAGLGVRAAKIKV